MRLNKHLIIKRVTSFGAAWAWLALGIMTVTRYDYSTVDSVVQLLVGSWLIVYAVKEA